MRVCWRRNMLYLDIVSSQSISLSRVLTALFPGSFRTSDLVQYHNSFEFTSPERRSSSDCEGAGKMTMVLEFKDLHIAVQ